MKIKILMSQSEWCDVREDVLDLPKGVIEDVTHEINSDVVVMLSHDTTDQILTLMIKHRTMLKMMLKQ